MGPAMKRPWLLAAVAATALASCDGDMGVRGPCANPTGSIVGCEPEPIETADDACWKLVACGVIPFENPPDPDNDDRRGWAECIRDIEDLPAEREQLVLACVEAATCIDLLTGQSPLRYDENLCFGETD